VQHSPRPMAKAASDPEPAAPDLFLDQAMPLLDWTRLAAVIGAVEARVGLPVSIGLFKMTLLERWYQLSSPELDDACHGRAAFRRFLAAPLHGPVVEVRTYRQLKPKLTDAERELGRLISAVEAMLGEQGLAPPTCAWTGAETAAITQPSEGIRTSVFEPGRLSAIAAQAEWAASDMQRLPGLPTTPRAPAMLVWSWGASTAVDRMLPIGRDPEFSPFARQLWADPRISRRHAEVAAHEGAVLIRDLGSSNGTYVGDALVPYGGSVLLCEDVLLQFGTNLAVKLVFYPAEAAPA